MSLSTYYDAGYTECLVKVGASKFNNFLANKVSSHKITPKQLSKETTYRDSIKNSVYKTYRDLYQDLNKEKQKNLIKSLGGVPS